MKKKTYIQKLTSILVLMTAVFCQANGLKAQSKTLPYQCGWDNGTEKAGWTFHQLKSTAYSNWGYAGATGSADYVDHDYPVGNPGTDTVEDWFVSPALNVPRKSEISLSANVYVIAGIQPSDYFGVWYSTKSADPKTGDFKELANLTTFASTVFNNWHDTSGILLNDSGTAVYIAFKYEESQNWFTVGIDTLLVKGIHTSGIEGQGKLLPAGISIYPNPSHGNFSIRLPENMASENAVIEIYDLTGRQLMHKETNSRDHFAIAAQTLGAGMYLCRAFTRNGQVFAGKLVIE